jgi:uncharacterized protein
MTNYFLDSSALVKRYVSEIGSAWIESITSVKSGNAILVAHITQAEVVSATMGRKRDGTISARTARAVRLLIDRHMIREYSVASLTNRIVQRAEDLLEKHALRAYDSVQLASAIEANQHLVGTLAGMLAFVSADSRLLAVATLEGLSTDDPNAHP